MFRRPERKLQIPVDGISSETIAAYVGKCFDAAGGSQAGSSMNNVSPLNK
jgi:hypothetical protein